MTTKIDQSNLIALDRSDMVADFFDNGVEASSTMSGAPSRNRTGTP